MTLACGSGGKVYAGLGTTSPAIACFHKETGVLEIVLEGPPDTTGSAAVHQGCDGAVYGWLPSGENGDGIWYLLGEQGAEQVAAEEVNPSLYKGAGYNKLHRDLDAGRVLLKWQLSDRQIEIMEADGSLSRLPLAYKGGGTSLSPLFGGPDGILYGTSNHPLHLFTYDAAAGRLTDWGRGYRGAGRRRQYCRLCGSRQPHRGCCLCRRHGPFAGYGERMVHGTRTSAESPADL
ncbi:hypothetical protein [Paenibacillus sp. DMB20]|uniref:hypothetical protein n=1 Tax=Paenibacillus sp. DMB20 TaxID=1642570 RepID=UPI000A61E49F|nr:hypothetical protein [Paenibacillus sp. DMB20]